MNESGGDTVVTDSATVLIEPGTTPATEAKFHGADANVVTLGRNDLDSE